jgi:arylsulfatase A-like enzyme
MNVIKQNNFKWVVGVSILSSLTCQAVTEPGVVPHPNVIFVLSDDQGYGDFGCFGNKYVSTPNMDRLYSESTRLTDFYMCPVCAPTRASLLTGRYNYRTPVWDTWQGGLNMSTKEFTIAEAMKQAGYKTALFGKWHLGYNYPMRPQDQGFDEVLLWDMFHKPENNRKDPVMIHNGKFVATQGFEDDIVFDHAIDYLTENKESGQPFFMVVASLLPHVWVDYQVPPEYVEKFKRNPEINDFNAEVYGMLEKLDENVGRLLDAMDSLGMTEDTVVIFTSDNGPHQDQETPRFNRNLRGGKGTTYEGGIKLPCFIRWPAVLSAGRDVGQVGVCTDFMPTVLDLCGIELDLPNKPDGMSLWPYINGTATEKTPRTFCGQFHRVDAPTLWENSYIRDGDYKLINGVELYNLALDPLEQNNLSDRMPETVDALRGQYGKWFEDVTRQTVENGVFRINPTIVGSDRQLNINLRYSDEHPERGWPMQVVHPGPYRIVVTQMQNDLFDETSSMQIRFGGQMVEKKILPNDGQLVFDDVVIPPGSYDMKLKIRGTFKYRKYRYSADVGHRNIYIQRVERP